MKTLATALIIFSEWFLLFQISETAIAQRMASYAPGEVIVKLKGQHTFTKKNNDLLSSGLAKLDAVLQEYNIRNAISLFKSENADRNLQVSLGLDRIYILHFPVTTDVNALAAELSKLQDVEYAEPDYVGCGAGVSGVDSLIPNDTYFSRQWAFQNNGSNLSQNSGKRGADIKATPAWAICKGDSNIIVADLDTGLKYDHPDIADRVWVNKKEIPGNGIDDDGNGYVDDVHGWNFAYNNNNVGDDYGHGTNTASIIAAKSNNGLGYAGLDWACKIMPLKELDSTDSGLYSWWASALYYAANNGARVINMSEGGSSSSPTLKTAIDYAYARGCFIAAAMMNNNDSTPYYPAAYHDHVMSVGATDPYDRRCNPFFWGGGSSYGSWIDVVAPGNYIYGLNNTSNTNYSWYWGGTSQATPMVVGLAALLLAQDSTRTPVTLRNIIRATADDTVGLRTEDKVGFDVYYGYGRINCYKALTYLRPNSISEKHTFTPSWNLNQNYPNPFNPSTIINFAIPTRMFVSLKIYDLLGREVATLVSGELSAGNHTRQWNAEKISSGVYFYRLEARQTSNSAFQYPLQQESQAGSFVETKKLILLR